MALMAEEYGKNPGTSLAPFLPYMFTLKGDPYSLAWSHYFFENLFTLGDMTPFSINKTGRQVAKSTTQAASAILRATLIPFFNVLSVTPLFEQVRKYSSNYVKPFIDGFVAKDELIDPSASDSVLQRTLKNGSLLFFGYANKSADRLRGISCSQIDEDELQDMDLDLLPVVEAANTASKFRIVRRSGTPKTTNNPLQVEWEKSSKGEWATPCVSCNHENIATVKMDLLKMIGKYTLVCAKCGKPLDTRKGYWLHENPEKRLYYPGRHVPQVILPMHYGSPINWKIITDDMRVKPKWAIYNEIFGESYDNGQMLITVRELQQQGQNIPHIAPSKHVWQNYVETYAGADWGGRGKESAADTESFVSRTAVALAALRGDGRVEIPSIAAFEYTASHSDDAQAVKNFAAEGNAAYIAHDFGGAGSVVEELLIRQGGWPAARIIPFTYSTMSVNKPVIWFQQQGARGARASYTLDKTRSLELLIQCIKAGIVLLPRYEDTNGLLDDFLNLYEEVMASPRKQSRKLIRRMHKKTDDVVHAINFAVMGCFQHQQKWPDLAMNYLKPLAGEEDEEGWDPQDLFAEDPELATTAAAAQPVLPGGKILGPR